jgi:hypothetical protein
VKPHRVFARSYRQIENPDPPAKPGKKMSKEDWKGEIGAAAICQFRRHHGDEALAEIGRS